MKKISIIILLLFVFTLSNCSNGTSGSMAFTTTSTTNTTAVTNACSVQNNQNTDNIPSLPYNIVDTGQNLFFNNANPISEPNVGSAFYGEDAMYIGNQPMYKDNCDGTISDLVTGLMWTKSTDWNHDGVINAEDKMTLEEATSYASQVDVGNYTDWRLPTIKELYSLINYTGKDISGETSTDTSTFTPFIDTQYFDFNYGDLSAGERLIDAQYVSSTLYGDESGFMGKMVFGVNFADGRIKGYGLINKGTLKEKTFYVIYVRGNQQYGINDFHDNSDGTITDNATGLMWMSTGSVATMNWEEALNYAENFSYAGHDDWRLPNAKELQSIVDYSRCPGITDSPAINPLFTLATMTNEAGQTDYGYYWTSTTFENTVADDRAVYFAFGRAMGYINGNWEDVHGAGAQRSDPKAGNPKNYPTGMGPQGDAIRIYNYVILVRNAK